MMIEEFDPYLLRSKSKVCPDETVSMLPLKISFYWVMSSNLNGCPLSLAFDKI